LCVNTIPPTLNIILQIVKFYHEVLHFLEITHLIDSDVRVCENVFLCLFQCLLYKNKQKQKNLFILYLYYIILSCRYIIYIYYILFISEFLSTTGTYGISQNIICEVP